MLYVLNNTDGRDITKFELTQLLLSLIYTQLVHGNIEQALINSYQGLLTIETGGLDCPLLQQSI